MRITKYDHACLVIEEGGGSLVVDPGSFTKLPELNNVQAIFVTHIHSDHLDIANLKKIIGINPNAVLYGSDEVVDEVNGLDIEKKTVKSGEILTLDNLSVEVFGQSHAIIYQRIPCLNLGILVNGKLYYPGDSFVLPDRRVEVLAVPANAPWMKVSEAMEFIKSVNPSVVFPTHNGLLSGQGESIYYKWLSEATVEAAADWRLLRSGEYIDIT